jgi:SAM-dependent methyltransferase
MGKTDLPIDNFNQNDYWIQRHRRLKNDPRSVGNLGKTLEQNVADEKRVQYWIRCAAHTLKPYASVLDIGCGYGRVASMFCEEGYAYTGIDVSAVAIKAARKNEPRGSYMMGSALEAEFARDFDLVCVLYVFVHFVSDGQWRQLISKLAGTLVSGGGLLFADNFPEEQLRPAPHVALRPLLMYEQAFATCGMKFEPSFRPRLAAALGPDATLPPVYLACKQA